MLGYASDDPSTSSIECPFMTDKGPEVYALTDEDTGVIKAIVCAPYTDARPN